MTINKKLPKGWCASNISKIISTNGLFKDGDWVESKDQDPNGNVRLIQLADIGICEFKNKSNRFLTSKKSKILNCTFLQHNDVLVARMPDPLGRACLFFNNDKQCVTVVDIAIIRIGKNGSDPKWLMYIINCPQFQNNIHHLKSGTTRMRISKKNLDTIMFPVPPLNEQKRIVSKIESILTQIDVMEKHQKSVLDMFGKLKISILKQTFEGKTVMQDPNDESLSMLHKKLKDKKIIYPNNLKKYQIPKNWILCKLNEVGDIVTGSTPNTKKIIYYGGNIPFFKPTDLNAGYHVHDSKTKLSKLGILKTRQIPKKSIMVTCIGIIGRIGLNRVAGSTNQQINSIIPFINIVIPEYLYFICRSPQFKESLLNVSSSTILSIINKSKFSKLVIPIAPLNEQKRIVFKIELIFNKIDMMEKRVDHTLKSLYTLKQNMLKQAFEGKLVPQDPNDESAEILLKKT